jgi:cytochrome c556
MIRAVIASLSLAVAATAVLASPDAIKQRQDIMKGVGDATKAPGAMLKGEAPFELAKVKTALNTYIDASKKMPGLFPPDSKTGNDTTAAPKIWEDKAGFDGNFKKLGDDSAAALTSIKDEASFKGTFPTVLKNCGGCHETYRIKKS